MGEGMQPHGQILVYAAEDGRLKIDVRLENESVWLTQAHLAELFQTTVPNISMHLRNIFEEGELQRDSVVAGRERRRRSESVGVGVGIGIGVEKEAG